MNIDIDAIEARANAATPGPWKYVDTEEGLFGVEMDSGHNVLWDMEGTCDRCFGNMRFIAAARQDVPALCAEVRELRAALGRLQGEVETIINTEPHADSCPIGIDGLCNCWQARLSKALDGDK